MCRPLSSSTGFQGILATAPPVAGQAVPIPYSIGTPLSKPAKEDYANAIGRLPIARRDLARCSGDREVLGSGRGLVGPAGQVSPAASAEPGPPRFHSRQGGDAFRPGALDAPSARRAQPG